MGSKTLNISFYRQSVIHTSTLSKTFSHVLVTSCITSVFLSGLLFGELGGAFAFYSFLCRHAEVNTIQHRTGEKLIAYFSSTDLATVEKVPLVDTLTQFLSILGQVSLLEEDPSSAK